jgi:IgA Peptidase M64/Putative Ig domain
MRVVRCFAIHLAVVLLVSATAGAAPDADLRKRWEGRDAERRAHEVKLERARSDRLDALRAAGVIGVVPLGGTAGDPSRSVDIAFIGDGFSAADREAWIKAADRMAANFETPPFGVHADRLNLYRIDLDCERSGTAIDGEGPATPLAGNVRRFPGGKLLICNLERAVSVARLAIPHLDYLMVVLNTHGKFLGSANSGAIVLLSTAGGHQRSIVVHEFGHNFAGLVDEYVDPKQSGGRPPPAGLARGANVSLEKNVHLTKWHHWNIPEPVFRGITRGKPFDPLDVMRCFEGAATFPDGVYRPEENCHMQRGRGKAFCRCCAERLEIVLYRYFSVIESVSPPVERVLVKPGRRGKFEVTPLRLVGEAESVRVAWYLDGRPVSRRKVRVAGPKDAPVYRCELGASDIEEGDHHLTVRVEIDSPRVHMDRGWLAGTYDWSVRVGRARTPLSAPTRVIATVGEPLALRVGTRDDGPPTGWTLADPPDGARLNASTGEVSWTPTAEQVGAWIMRLVNSGDTQEILVAVRPATRRKNQPPRILWQPGLTVREGGDVECRLRAWDPDGDRVAWTAEDLPDGARLDAATGRFCWTIGATARGRREIAFEATDGRASGKTTITVEIQGRARLRGIFKIRERATFTTAADRLRIGLRHPDPAVRLRCGKWLDDAPPPVVLSESIRLIREVHPELAALALGHLKRIFDEASGRRGAAAVWHLDMFLDEMPRRIWQFVDRKEDREALAALCRTALKTAGLARKSRKALEALIGDVAAIGRYDGARREWEAPPPITDKKHR